MSEVPATTQSFREVYERIKAILTVARGTAYRAINTAMVTAYWEIGRTIVENEQQGQQRAEYGRGLLLELSQHLTAEFGRGYDRTNLQQMRTFYLAYAIRDALRHELSWTHYRLLLRVEKPDARAFYEVEAVNSRWSTRELERQIHSLLYERLALSRDKDGLLSLAQKGHEIQQPTDLIKDPYASSIFQPKANWPWRSSGNGNSSRWSADSGKAVTLSSAWPRRHDINPLQHVWEALHEEAPYQP